MDIKDEIAIVTGGASGMGRATAEELINQGARVVILDFNDAALQQTLSDLGCDGFQCDVSDTEAVEAVITQVHDECGIPRVLVNCAGIAPAKRTVGREGPMPLDDFAQVIRVNLVGTFNVIRVVADLMVKNDPLGDSVERGVIINTASIASFEGQIGQAAYSASKGGIVSMTLPLAREFAQHGIRVMAIAPGLVATPMLTSMPQEVQKDLAQTVPFPKRLAQPKEFADLVQHIIGNQMLNGEVIRLDGALRMQAR